MLRVALWERGSLSRNTSGELKLKIWVNRYWNLVKREYQKFNTLLIYVYIPPSQMEL
jgi:hypothetical protein